MPQTRHPMEVLNLLHLLRPWEAIRVRIRDVLPGIVETVLHLVLRPLWSTMITLMRRSAALYCAIARTVRVHAIPRWLLRLKERSIGRILICIVYAWILARRCP